VTGEFQDLIWGLVFFNVADAIFDGRKGASEDSHCVHLGVCQVAEVNVAGSHIGLELLTPIEVGTRCDSGIAEPAPRFSVRNVALRLPHHQQNVKTSPGPPRGIMVPLVLLVHPEPPWSIFSLKFEQVWIRMDRSGAGGPRGPQPPLVDQERSGTPWTTLRHFPDATCAQLLA